MRVVGRFSKSHAQSLEDMDGYHDVVRGLTVAIHNKIKDYTQT
jgi:hypothetical protein